MLYSKSFQHPFNIFRPPKRVKALVFSTTIKTGLPDRKTCSNIAQYPGNKFGKTGWLGNGYTTCVNTVGNIILRLTSYQVAKIGKCKITVHFVSAKILWQIHFNGSVTADGAL